MSSPIPILYVHTTGLVAGGEKCLLALLDILDRRTFAPIVYCPDDGPLPAMLEQGGIEVIAAEGMSYLFRRASGPLDVVANARRFAGTIGELTQLVRQRRIGLLHAFSTSAFKYVGVLSRITRCPALGSMHTILANPQRPPRWGSAQPALTPRWGIAQLALNINLNFRQVICVSRAVEEALRSQGVQSSKVRTIYNGLDVKPYQVARSETARVRAEIGVAPDMPLIGMVGRFEYWKGHDVLLHSLALLRDRHPAFQVVVVGDAVFETEAETKRRVLALADRLRLHDHVRFVGWRNDVPVLMAACDLTVVPSTLPDPFPTVVLESMAAGTPVVASNQGGAAEVIADGVDGYLVPPQDPPALARGIAQLLADPSRRSEMGARARERIAGDFSVDRYVHGIENLYLEVLGQ